MVQNQGNQKYIQKNLTYAILQSENALSVSNLSHENMNLHSNYDPAVVAVDGKMRRKASRSLIPSESRRLADQKEVSGSQASLNQDLVHLPYVPGKD